MWSLCKYKNFSAVNALKKGRKKEKKKKEKKKEENPGRSGFFLLCTQEKLIIGWVPWWKNL